MAEPIRMLRLSKGMQTGRVVTWLKQVGDEVQPGEAIVEIETEKSVVEVEADTGGVILELLVSEDEEVPVGTVLGWIGEPGETPAPIEASSAAPAPAASDRKVRAAPALRRLARQHDIDLQTVTATGPGGRITKQDLEAAIATKDAPSSEAALVERIALKGIRRTMAQRMAQSAHTTAAVTTVVDVDMGRVVDLKKTHNVTFTSAVVKATAAALKQHGILNAALEADEILLYKQINIAVAVAGKHGLTMLSIADADQKSLTDINTELGDMARQARAGSLKLEHTAAPTFTITNSGVLGALLFTPIINPPQSAILGMGKVQDTPVARAGQIVITPLMYLCLTYDHRIVEGAEAVAALQVIKQGLEDPTWMI